MAKLVFINLPVTDLPRAEAFYGGLGFTRNPAYSDATAACMVWSEHIYAMLLTHEKWSSFTSRPIPPKGQSEVMVALTQDGRAEVDRLATAAGANGGAVDVNPVNDMGFMYTRTVTDPDGHVWELFWMDPAAQGG